MSIHTILDMRVLSVKTLLSCAARYFPRMKPDIKQVLRNNLAAALDRRQTTITALAGSANHQRTFDRVFKVENWPRLDTLIQVCDALGVEVWQMLWPDYDPHAPSSRPLDAEKLRGAINAAVGLAIEYKPNQDDLAGYIYGFITDIYFDRHASRPNVLETGESHKTQTDPKKEGSEDVRRDGKLLVAQGMDTPRANRAGLRNKPELARAHGKAGKV